MQEEILTDNISELLLIRWDGERFALVHWWKMGIPLLHTTILNPKEMLNLVEFAGKMGGE